MSAAADPRRPPDAEHPKVSIVIPARNEGGEIEACLKSLMAQRFRDFEILVVDNGSTDDTEAIARRYGCRVVHEARPGVAFARQRGFEAARGEIIASTDADTTLPPDWLELIVRSFGENPDQVGVFGKILLRGRQGFGQWLAEFLFTLFLRLNSLLGRPHFCGPNFAVRRTAFHRVGGFKNGDRFYTASEDLQLSLKLAREGYILFHRELVAYSSSRKLSGGSLRYIWEHTKNYWSVAWLRRTR
ncbi:MAG: glycosyltransferase family 2 protein [Candidatus Acetothermia bacterium]|nr:glycosyltransferase family 2 protein [Candidatus Acetothermia bacterium]MDH7504988.1 glycosyltransferase family 2 protein [Candidatus Acetothermia bacterium]